MTSGYNERGIYSLQTKKIKTNDDNIFYLLYHIYWDGEYNYPALEVGWRVYKTCKVWVITEDEYNKLLNPEVGITTINLYDWALTSPYPTQKSIDWLNSGINNILKDAIESGISSKPYLDRTSKWYIKVEEDEKTIRFQLPTDKYLWSDAEKINKENESKQITNKYFYFTPISKSDCINFDEQYFEISKTQFDGLIIK